MSGEVKWGPAILEGGKWFLFEGKRRPMPINVQDQNKFLEQLRLVDKFSWAYSTPEQRQRIFVQKLHDAVALTQPNWATGALVICTIASTVFIFVALV